MERIRWFFALPDPREDVSQKDAATLNFYKWKRRQDSPLWHFYWKCQRVWGFISDALWGIWKCAWHATLGRWVYIKNSRMSGEADTMRFVASQTSIPVPRIWMCVPWRGREYAFMSRVRGGVVLEDVWDKLSEPTKGIIAEQIQGYVSQLRAIPPPVGLKSICSLQGGPVRCYRLHDEEVTGPFRDEEHMSLQLRHCRPVEAYPEIVQIAHARQHPLVFTHNDLFPRNIMIEEKTGRVLAVLDWESAGWFPAHWEYCKTRNWGTWNILQKEWMTKWVPKMIPVYEEEAEADKYLMYKSGSTSVSPGRHAK